MTPAERQLVSELFDRLATLEDAQRDPEAERLIRDGLAQAPNAVYALVQTALVQDEALKQADARIQELEAELAGPPPQQGGFLDNMRDSLFGRRPEQRGSVPSVRPDGPMGVPPGFGTGGAPPGAPGYRPDGQMPPPPEPQGRGGSFLGTAAAAAAGVIGGSLLLDGIRSMTGARHGGGFGLSDPAAASGRGGGSPWGNSGGGGGDDLARQAGISDIGRSGSDPFAQSQGAFREAGGGKAGDAGDVDHTATDDNDFELDDSDDFEGDFDSDFDSDE
jgi:hypothetical protein